MKMEDMMLVSLDDRLIERPDIRATIDCATAAVAKKLERPTFVCI